MNKTKIEWTDYTWNPVTGCRRNCWYCYVDRIQGYSKTPTFHRERLAQPVKVRKPSKIFVCSTADLFGEWVPDEWIYEILAMTKQAGWHTYQILTKNPKRLQNFRFEKNIWLGATVEDSEFATRVIDLLSTKHENLFVSFEPLITRMNLPQEIYADIKWIIIGAMTGPESQNYQPKVEWIEELLRQAYKFMIPVFMKNNLNRAWRKELRQEFPL